jgi:hypothetical protein
MKFDTRNPKLEINSKLEDRRIAGRLNYIQMATFEISNFGFGISFGFRASNFELL